MRGALVLGPAEVRWNLLDYWLLVLPYAAWATGCELHGMGSLFGPFLLGASVPIAPLARIAVGRNPMEPACSGFHVAAFAAAGFWVSSAFPFGGF